MLLLGLGVLGIARAEVETWVGGGVGVVTGISEAGVAPVGQAELDFELYSGPATIRLDLDLNGIDLKNPETVGYQFGADGQDFSYLPEGAYAQFDDENGFYARGGLITAPIGVEDWDEWSNYVPSHSVLFNGVTGRVGGVEAGFSLESGVTPYLHAGYDVDYDAPAVAVGAVAEEDAWATWSGVFSYPTLNYHGIHLVYETYPLDALWLTFAGGGGVFEGGGYAGGNVTANVMPEAMVQPFVRLEGTYDPDLWLGAPPVIASAGARVIPLDGLKIGLEGRVAGGGDFDLAPGAIVSASFARPYPPEEE